MVDSTQAISRAAIHHRLIGMTRFSATTPACSRTQSVVQRTRPRGSSVPELPILPRSSALLASAPPRNARRTKTARSRKCRCAMRLSVAIIACTRARTTNNAKSTTICLARPASEPRTTGHSSARNTRSRSSSLRGVRLAWCARPATGEGGERSRHGSLRGHLSGASR